MNKILALASRLIRNISNFLTTLKNLALVWLFFQVWLGSYKESILSNQILQMTTIRLFQKSKCKEN